MTGSAVGEGTPSSGRKVRYIAFIGNLPFTVTGDDIVEHFQKKGVNITEVRMLTKKGSGESRGCCFAEFRDAKSLQNALKFHHTLMAGRRLNLEVTCGGGGKASERMKKIRDRNETLRKAQRRKSKTKNSQPQSLQ
jgi:nucleolar protein 6